MITQTQYESLVNKVYHLLILNPDMGMGEMGDCMDEATSVVDEWIDENGITLLMDKIRVFDYGNDILDEVVTKVTTTENTFTYQRDNGEIVTFSNIGYFEAEN